MAKEGKVIVYLATREPLTSVHPAINCVKEIDHLTSNQAIILNCLQNNDAKLYCFFLVYLTILSVTVAQSYVKHYLSIKAVIDDIVFTFPGN